MSEIIQKKDELTKQITETSEQLKNVKLDPNRTQDVFSASVKHLSSPPQYVANEDAFCPIEVAVADDVTSARSSISPDVNTTWMEQTIKPMLNILWLLIQNWWLGFIMIVVVVLIFVVGRSDLGIATRSLIPSVFRVMIGIIASVVLIVCGELFRKKIIWRIFGDALITKIAKHSYLLTCGGLVLLYKSIHSAVVYHQIINDVSGLAFMNMVTVFGLMLSVWVNAIAIAVLATVGGFMTPLIVSTGAPDEAVLFIYLTLLNLGVLGVAFTKKWQYPLIILGFVLTISHFSYWYDLYYAIDKLDFAVFALIIFYLTYLLVGIFSAFITPRQTDSVDILILIINAVWFFAWIYFLLSIKHPEYKYYLEYVSISLLMVYTLFAYIAYKVVVEDKKLLLSLGGLAVIFAIFTMPILGYVFIPIICLILFRNKLSGGRIDQ